MDDNTSSASDGEGDFQLAKTGRYRRLQEENEALKRQNAALLEQVKTLLVKLQSQEEKIASMERAAAQRHEEMLNQFRLMSRNQQTSCGEKMEVQVTPAATVPSTSNPGKRPASPIQNDAKKQGVVVSEKSDKPPVTNRPSSSSSVSGQKKEKIPPVILKKQERWGEVSRLLSQAKIGFVKAKLTGGEIQVEPATADDHRKLTKMLTERKEEYYTYSLPDARHLRVVLRGLPESIPAEEVKADLESQGFKVYEALRMTNRRTKKTMPLVLVKLPQDQDGVMKVNRCCSLVIKVEKQREAARVAQCFRCQGFGHAQSNCRAEHRCVKCASNHSSNDCPKSREDPAICANCGGAHPASYRGCPKQPKRVAKRTPAVPAQRSPPKKTAPPAQKVTPNKSFAEAAKGKKVSKTSLTPLSSHREEAFSAASLTAALAQMQQMCSAMSAFFAKMPASLTS